MRGVGQWLFSKDGETVLPELNPVVVCDKTPAVQACVLAGIGLGIFPDFAVEDEIAEGRLVRVFPTGACPPAASMPSFHQPASGRPRCAPSWISWRRQRGSGSEDEAFAPS
ncbi:LysR substrate-binding domain-containing protein [Mesorhizobium sp. M1E.F.Ca.ET.063.01.1.1]|uniref:LysR substrate-binding domain-containing protein n=1 Tax=Mesorhizobium sp. M1E.F.Ca.ET.063.01.1.1 TaxID=2496750 RepID=UPI001FE11343|nr:LysR substrate-binding domain-containing protein [Mesorhizobium sp. M1E.F.Ca.ET.063.01.1.1]